MSSTPHYAVLALNHAFDGEVRQLESTSISAVYPTLAAANLAAWKEFSDILMYEDEEDYDASLPPSGRKRDEYGGLPIDVPGDDNAMASWRVGKREGEEVRDEFGRLVTTAEGGWGFIVAGPDTACEVAVVKTKVVGAEPKTEELDVKPKIEVKEEEVKGEPIEAKIEAKEEQVDVKIENGNGPAKKRKI